MNEQELLFGELPLAKYEELPVVLIGGVRYVDVQKVLDILAKRYMLFLRQQQAIGAPSHTTDFLKGRAAEIKELQNTLTNKSED